MPLAKPITVTLDRKRKFQWSNAARYRVGCLKLKPDGSYATLVATLWACLVPDDARDFASPEHLALILPDDRLEEFAELCSRLVDQMKGPEEKNGDGSTPAPSPASSSE
jgi:hypothetical protein